MALLELLVAVQERGSVRAAASSVGMSQPNASRALSRWERRLGLALLQRTTRGARLTREGMLIVDWARPLLASADALTSAVASLQKQSAVQVRIAASQTVAEYLVPQWLALHRAQRPDVEVRLTVANSEQVMDQVAGGKADLGFVETTALPRHLPARQVDEDQLVVVATKDHPWVVRGRPVAAEELAATPLIVREQGSGTRVALENALAAVGLRLAPPALSVESNAAVRVSAMAGVAPAVLSEHAVQEALVSGRLQAVLVTGLSLRRPLRAVWPASTWPSGAAGDVLRTICQVTSTP
ncbi:MAG: LysR family transcriptional regulator [Acidobacteria bacterium]|nr:MAG: LysR family transcriptional regulator [Acidobacteriota bacterium]